MWRADPWGQANGEVIVAHGISDGWTAPRTPIVCGVRRAQPRPAWLLVQTPCEVLQARIDSDGGDDLARSELARHLEGAHKIEAG